MKVPRSSLAAASVVVNGIGYVFFGGGSYGGYKKTVEVYKVDSTGDVVLWKYSHIAENQPNTAPTDSNPNKTYVAPLKTGRYLLAAASVVVDGVGYVFFAGGDGASSSNAVEVYKVDSTGDVSLWRWSYGNTEFIEGTT